MSSPAALDARTRDYPGLNALRAVGAIMVVTTHTGFNTGQILHGWTGAVLARLDFGVAIFFVLSGFLLSRPFLIAAATGRRSPRTGPYFWKRGLRILPLYWVTIAVVAVTMASTNSYVTTSMWVRNLTLAQLYHPDLLPQGLTQMWSLATEAAFYVALPLLMALLLRRRTFSEPRILSALAVISVAGLAWQGWAVTVPGGQGHYAQWLPGYLPWFCAGIALATVSVGDTLGRNAALRVHRLAADPAGCWVAAAAIFAIACTPVAGPRNLDPSGTWEALIKAVLYGASATLLVLPLVFGRADAGLIRRWCNSRAMHFLGEISYGIFCLHLIFLNSILDRPRFGTFHGHFVQVWALTLGCTIVAATAAHYAVERPFLRLKSLGSRRTPPPSKPPAASAKVDARAS